MPTKSSHTPANTPHSGSLASIESYGSRCSRSTNWMTIPGYHVCTLSDGRKITLSVDNRSVLERLREKGIDTADYERRGKLNELQHGYPPTPEGVELYQHDYNYEKPVELGEWQWSTTFGQWGRLVRFADGWHGLTWPKNGVAISKRLRQEAIAKLTGSMP